MVKKKNKDDDVAAPSSIFSTLFGGVADDNAPVSSIFSDDNPFKRKQQESQKLDVEPIANPKITDSMEPDATEVKKKKKKKDKKPNVIHAENTETPEKSMAMETENPNLETSGEKKKRKKRKRDEVEREYEEKIYGVKAEEKEEGKTKKKAVVGEKRKKAEDETEEVFDTSKEEGFDDESKLLRTVFVGNLPLKLKKKALLKEFSKFGEVESVRIRSVPIADTKIPRKAAVIRKQINDNADSVHAYIVYKSEQSAEAALAHNMAVVGGNHIRVDRACPPRKKLKGESAPLYDNKRTVFVGNLPFDVKDEEVYQLFCGLTNLESSVEAIRVIRDPHNGVGKGIAYVLFKTREAANLVVKKRKLKLRDRELRLSHAQQQNSTPSKRKNTETPSVVMPSKKLAFGSRSPNTTNGSNTKPCMSYQGLRASKSGVSKKVHSGTSIKPVKMKKSRSKKEVDKPKERLEKRPAVALRKAKAKAFKEGGGGGGGGSKHSGAKRKLDSRTPQSFQMKKKARKFR